ncbi:virulence protein [uncultured Clostridium sp.]|uniref:virulence protein n=1 Tax=uncultured Clostridium sp. TaxID=59620 RepID=UPI0025EB5DB9|nr:virulence protein [uncultured Clostridium sp.]
MRIEFNRTGAERKALVTAMGETLNVKPKYCGVPSMAYEIDYFAVDKQGAVTFDDSADSEEIENLLEQLADRGIAAGTAETAQAWLSTKGEELIQESNTKPQGETVGLTVAMPLDTVLAGNLTNLLEAKGNLIKKALGISELPIIIDEEKISFPWFKDNLDADMVKAYTDFIAALCKMSKEQKRISNIEKEVENEKYAFRCLLLRLGFVGAEYKKDRKILLKNLTGSSAFKNGAKEVAIDEISE